MSTTKINVNFPCLAYGWVNLRSEIVGGEFETARSGSSLTLELVLVSIIMTKFILSNIFFSSLDFKCQSWILLKFRPHINLSFQFIAEMNQTSLFKS